MGTICLLRLSSCPIPVQLSANAITRNAAADLIIFQRLSGNRLWFDDLHHQVIIPFAVHYDMCRGAKHHRLN